MDSDARVFVLLTGKTEQTRNVRFVKNHKLRLVKRYKIQVFVLLIKYRHAFT